MNLKIVLSVLPLCTIAIKLGHAGITDLSVYKNMLKKNQQTSSENQKR